MNHRKIAALFFNLVLALALAIITLPAQAAVPSTLNYQGQLTNAAGVPVNGLSPVSMTFSLYTVPMGISPPAVWSETQPVTVSNGLYSVTLGQTAPLTPTLFGVPLYLGITVGADAEMIPRIAMGSSATALRASFADNVTATNAIVSTVATGTAPLTIASTTVVPNLNADMVDGKHAADFVSSTNGTMVGTLTVTGAIRSGIETGTSQPPYYPPGSTGMIIRRIYTTYSMAGQIVARTDSLQLERDGTNGGWRINMPVVALYQSISCMGINSTGVSVNFNAAIPAAIGTTVVYTDAQALVYINCSFGFPFGAGHETTVSLRRQTGDYFWMGHLTSTYNQ